MYATPTWYIFPAPRLSPSGGVDSSLFEYAPMQAKDEHTRFKKFMSKILEQRAGYGREEGSKPPALSAKWEQMALHGARVEYSESRVYNIAMCVRTVAYLCMATAVKRAASRLRSARNGNRWRCTVRE